MHNLHTIELNNITEVQYDIASHLSPEQEKLTCHWLNPPHESSWWPHSKAVQTSMLPFCPFLVVPTGKIDLKWENKNISELNLTTPLSSWNLKTPYYNKQPRHRWHFNYILLPPYNHGQEKSLSSQLYLLELSSHWRLQAMNEILISTFPVYESVSRAPRGQIT